MQLIGQEDILQLKSVECGIGPGAGWQNKWRFPVEMIQQVSPQRKVLVPQPVGPSARPGRFVITLRVASQRRRRIAIAIIACLIAYKRGSYTRPSAGTGRFYMARIASCRPRYSCHCPEGRSNLRIRVFHVGDHIPEIVGGKPNADFFKVFIAADIILVKEVGRRARGMHQKGLRGA